MTQEEYLVWKESQRRSDPLSKEEEQFRQEMIYEHEELKKEVPDLAWVSASQVFTIDRILDLLINDPYSYDGQWLLERLKEMKEAVEEFKGKSD